MPTRIWALLVETVPSLQTIWSEGSICATGDDLFPCCPSKFWERAAANNSPHVMKLSDLGSTWYESDEWWWILLFEKYDLGSLEIFRARFIPR
jgi:hypothetical protein